jgi:hypothetical protein
MGLVLFNKQPFPYNLGGMGEIFMGVSILDHHIASAIGVEFQL